MFSLPVLYADVICTQAGKPRKPDGFVGASQIKPRQESCMKKLQFHLLKTQPHDRPLAFPLSLSLMRGTILHELVTRLSSHLPLKVESDVRMVSEEWNLSGSADFIMRDENDACVVELKSISPDQYRYLSKPILRHVYQVHVYMMLSGVRKAAIYYIPHSNEQDEDLPQILKRALKKSQGLGGPMMGVQDKIAEILSDLGEWKTMKKSDPTVLGRQFDVSYDDKIAEEIVSTMTEVVEANKRREWLEKNVDNCGLCPYIQPCFKGESFNACDKRSTSDV